MPPIPAMNPRYMAETSKTSTQAVSGIDSLSLTPDAVLKTSLAILEGEGAK